MSVPNYEAIIAWAAVAAALVAVAAVLVTIVIAVRESHRSRIALGVDLLMKLDDRFNGSMQEARATAARGLLAHRPGDSEDVLDFFETLEMLIREGVLGEEFVWHTFFHWIRGYRQAAQGHVRASREQEPTVWQDFERLYRRTARLEMQKRCCSMSELELTEDQTQQFLADEAGLAEAGA